MAISGLVLVGGITVAVIAFVAIYIALGRGGDGE